MAIPSMPVMINIDSRETSREWFGQPPSDLGCMEVTWEQGYVHFGRKYSKGIFSLSLLFHYLMGIHPHVTFRI